MLDRLGLDFSFSGLKTAALVALRGRDLTDAVRADVARGFEDAVVETLAEKCRRALQATGHRRLVIALRRRESKAAGAPRTDRR